MVPLVLTTTATCFKWLALCLETLPCMMSLPKLEHLSVFHTNALKLSQSSTRTPQQLWPFPVAHAEGSAIWNSPQNEVRSTPTSSTQHKSGLGPSFAPLVDVEPTKYAISPVSLGSRISSVSPLKFHFNLTGASVTASASVKTRIWLCLQFRCLWQLRQLTGSFWERPLRHQKK